MLNQYERANAAYKVDGYYNPCPTKNRSSEDSFEAAKEECLIHARKAVADIEKITYQEFLAGRCGK